MADSHEDRWRAKIPADFDGRQGENWDDEIDTGFAYRTAVLIVISLAFSIVLCLLMIKGIDALRDKPQSPIAEANARQLPPTPVLQSSPDEELGLMRAEMAGRLHGYGWTDQLDDRVHIPVDKAMELVLKGSPRIEVEPTAEPPVDVTPAPTPEPPLADQTAAPAHGGGH